MAVKLISFKCPECGADLNIEADRETAYCSYCGTKILIHNENEYIFKKIDVAEIKRAENEIELQKNQLRYDQKNRMLDLFVGPMRSKMLGILMGLIGLILVLFGVLLYVILRNMDAQGLGAGPVIAMVGCIIGMFGVFYIFKE